ncbi:MAG: hypothetical protein ACXW3M_01525 [Rhodoplanes sp.]
MSPAAIVTGVPPSQVQPDFGFGSARNCGNALLAALDPGDGPAPTALERPGAGGAGKGWAPICGSVSGRVSICPDGSEPVVSLGDARVAKGFSLSLTASELQFAAPRPTAINANARARERGLNASLNARILFHSLRREPTIGVNTERVKIDLRVTRSLKPNGVPGAARQARRAAPPRTQNGRRQLIVLLRSR